MYIAYLLELPELDDPDASAPEAPPLVLEEPEDPAPEEPPFVEEEPDVPDDPPLLMPEEPDPPVPDESEEPEEPEPLVPGLPEVDLGLLLSPLESVVFFFVELLPVVPEPDVTEASDAPVALALPDLPELPPVEEVCATATPLPSAETRIAIKTLFIHCLHPWKNLKISHRGLRHHSHDLPRTCWMTLEALVIGSSWSILYQNVTIPGSRSPAL